MCGIAGSLNWQIGDSEISIAAMISALAHRGPDAGQLKTIGPVVLGHRRLSIIDTRAIANQPMQDHSGHYWVVFNGEIYNFKELKTDLINKGSIFKTHSDTEIILEAWKSWDVDCLQRFIGMFAFALWDGKKQQLFVARDRMGEKPLYYMAPKDGLSNGVIFASELKALQKHPACQKSLNLKALNQFLSLNYILTDQCILENVYKLPPAHYLLFEKGKQPVFRKYWDLSFYFKNKSNWVSEKEAINKLNNLLDKVVSVQCISDVPLGAFLSGGIDSSTIVAAMGRFSKRVVPTTFSVDFQERSYSELEKSIRVSNYLNVENFSKTIHIDSAKALPKIAAAADEPFADTSMMPTYFLAKYAREKVKVCLSGDAGDELFLGYDTYVADKLYQLMHFLPLFVRKQLAKLVNNYFPTSFNKVSFDYKLKKFLYSSVYNFRRAHYFARTIFSEEEKLLLLRSDYRSFIDDSQPFKSFEKFYDEVAACHYLDQASYVDLKTWLVDDILVKVDRMAMANSLEIRVPFLDHRIVEFAASLPVNWKLRRFNKKYLLKKSQKSYLPRKILTQPKRGFNAPVSHWFQGDLQALGKQVTLDSRLSAWFNRSSIEQLWKEHSCQRRDNGLKLFGLTCFALWLDANI